MFESKTEYRTPPRILFVFQWRAKDTPEHSAEEPLCKEIPISWVPRAGDRVSFGYGDGLVFLEGPNACGDYAWDELNEDHFIYALDSLEVERVEWSECGDKWVCVFVNRREVNLERKLFIKAMEEAGWEHNDPWEVVFR